MDALKRKMEIAAVVFFCTVTALIAAYSCATTAAANLAQQTAAAPATEYVTLAYMEVQPEAEQEPELLYDVPMSDELQRCVREQAERQGVPFEIAIAVIERESSYQPDAVSDTGDFGLMQITQHFSLMPNDQTNIDSMFAAITLGASEYPYHPDGGKCVMYSAADIITLYSEYKSFVTKQTTYCNALRQWAKRETDPNVIGSIYYGCALPEDLEKEVGDILSAAQAQITAIINKLSA